MLKSAAKVARKKSAGIDGISAKSIKGYILENYEMIYQEILTDRYRPNKVLLKRIPKGNGKYRTLAIGTAIDRVILGCIYEYLYPGFDAGMSEYSYGFRKGKNCQQEIQTIINICDQENKWVTKIDLQNCFDFIDHDKILFMLRRKVEDKGLLRLLNQFMKVSYVNGRNEKKNLVGAPQGNSLSPLYANMILDAVDKMLNKQGHRYVRYADDLFIFCQSQVAAHRTLDMTKNFIERHCKLRVNEEKTRICSVEHGFNALGFHIYESNGEIHVVPKSESVQEIRQLLKHEIRRGRVDILPDRINEILRGWIAYYKIAEMSRITRSLDLYIQKQIRMVEKERSVNINKNNIINCNKLWKEGTPASDHITDGAAASGQQARANCSETFF